MQNKKDGNEEKHLISLSKTDSLLEHSIEECGKCYYNYIMSQVARDMLLSGDIGSNALKRWDKEVQKRWQNSKYYKLWMEEKEAGRDPKKAFEKRGWIV